MEVGGLPLPDRARRLVDKVARMEVGGLPIQITKRKLGVARRRRRWRRLQTLFSSRPWRSSHGATPEGVGKIKDSRRPLVFLVGTVLHCPTRDHGASISRAEQRRLPFFAKSYTEIAR
jgi:hypothetical protein